MKICYLADARAEHTRRWTRYFALKGHCVDLITWNQNILDGYEPVHLHVVNKSKVLCGILSRISNLPSILIEVKKIIRQTRPDLIHAHSSEAYAWLAMLTGFHPYVVTPWGTDILIDIKKSRWNRLVSTMALRHADLITCDAYHLKDELIRLGVGESKIRLVMFGTDIARFSPKKGEHTELRNQYELGHSQIVISTRTLTPVHDVETLVRSIPIIKQAVPRVTFVIIGDGSERRSLEALVNSIGVRDAVRFIGYLGESEMARWLCVADVYVSTSLYDAGLSASTAEAMACGIPVVITDNGDNGRWVSEGNGGFLIPNGASEVLADRIALLLKDNEMRKRFGHFNRQVIQEHNNYAMEMDRMETIYQELSCCGCLRSHS
jgi:glycosyltransferase involved in cell wall biosynthesis